MEVLISFIRDSNYWTEDPVEGVWTFLSVVIIAIILYSTYDQDNK